VTTAGATVVCGASGTDTEPVLDTARWLADGYNAQLVVVHAFDEPVADAEEVMTIVRRRTAADRHVETRLVEGSPAARLLDVVQEEAADLLVVGSRGRGAVAAAVLGSVSSALTTSASCPLVVVPPNAASVKEPSDGHDGTIVCGLDGSLHAVAAAVAAADIAAHLGCRVVLVHAPRDARSLVSYVGRSTTPSLSVQPDVAAAQSQEIVQEAVERLGDRPASAHVEAGAPAEVLQSVAKREHGRMIVIAARGVGGVHAAVLGSVAVSLIRSAEIPIVVLSEAAERAVAQAGPDNF
jgi:nucleotide-binding universal stress UspA family protein